MITKYRVWIEHTKGVFTLVSWIDKRCKRCGKFIKKHSRMYCPKCSYFNQLRINRATQKRLRPHCIDCGKLCYGVRCGSCERRHAWKIGTYKDLHINGANQYGRFG